MLTVERSKRRVEAITLVADFSERMAASDTIVDATITMQVFSGNDSSPEDMLYLPAIIDAQSVAQRVKEGVVGAVYNVQFSVLTANGLILDQTTRLAVLPDAPGAIPAYIALYFTSWPYPIDIVDGAAFSFGILPSRLRPQVFFQPEGIQMSFGLKPGTLIGALVTYSNLVEWLAFSLGPMSGALETVLVTYSNYVEGAKFDLGPMSGALYEHLVFYNIQAEGLQFALSSIGGTLE